MQGVKYSLVFLLLMVTACQKELDENAYATCVVSQVDIFEGAGSNVAESYWYEYDPPTKKVTAIIVNVPPLNFFRRIEVAYNGSFITLSGIGSIGLDAGRRVERLRIDHALPVADTGDYFYGYTGEGFLSDRLYDRGRNYEPENSRFSNDSSKLTGFEVRYGADPPIIEGTISYSSAPVLQLDMLIPYADIFPELLPFFPLVKLGKLGTQPPNTTTLRINLPNQASFNLVYQNSNYQMNDKGALSGFENTISVPGQPALRRRYLVTYTCL